MELKGNFQIAAWDETTTKEGENGSKQTTASVSQTYTGGLEGSSHIQYLMCYQSPQSAVFVGFETIECTLNNEAGSIILLHNGRFENGIASSQSTIVEGSGTGACAGISGEGSFTAPMGGTAEYRLSLT